MKTFTGILKHRNKNSRYFVQQSRLVEVGLSSATGDPKSITL